MNNAEIRLEAVREVIEDARKAGRNTSALEAYEKWLEDKAKDPDNARYRPWPIIFPLMAIDIYNPEATDMGVYRFANEGPVCKEGQRKLG